MSDKDWGDIAATAVKKLGLGGVDGPGGCRWVAIRHDPRHVHLVITLARQCKRADRI